MRTKKSNPQIGKREVLKLAKEALENPLGVLEQIADREQHAYSQLTFMCHGRGITEWSCTLSFTGCYSGAGGRAAKANWAVRVAILRAYDTGSEKDWQLRQKLTKTIIEREC